MINWKYLMAIVNMVTISLDLFNVVMDTLSRLQVVQLQSSHEKTIY
ncbi:unnamed protein product [Leptidea sinapis]|uniref:Uncharacterized protein n=1 Tax=Leptidea sinapis TaxID=189913 RepID=A0A5E4PZD0_9NEOP|nr:unnamed protein product [Leptidea sinapis]